MFQKPSVPKKIYQKSDLNKMFVVCYFLFILFACCETELRSLLAA